MSGRKTGSKREKWSFRLIFQVGGFAFFLLSPFFHCQKDVYKRQVLMSLKIMRKFLSIRKQSMDLEKKTGCTNGKNGLNGLMIIRIKIDTMIPSYHLKLVFQTLNNLMEKKALGGFVPHTLSLIHI